VRELKNVVERAVYRSDSSLIRDIIFDPFHSPPGQHRPGKEVSRVEKDKFSTEYDMNKPFNEAIQELKIRLLTQALRKSKYNQRKAARILGMTYDQFRGLYRTLYKDIKA
jgi:psp operon transcriptional activator